MTAHSNARPPQWAEALLRVMLKPEDRESVPGDLLEEYRETIVPTRGSAADRWYVRQVASFILRPSWIWGGIIGAALAIRYLFDTRVPPADYVLRATVLTYTIMAASLLTGFSTAWRGRSLMAGTIVSFSAATIGALISIVATGMMLAIWHDPTTLDAWRRSGGLDEALIDVPLKLIAIGVTLGFAGALFGKGMAAVARSH
jgi:hypothetical protein